MISSIARSRTRIALLSCLIFSPLAVAQPPRAAQATSQEIKTLLSLNGSERVAAQLGAIMAEQVITAMRQANPGLPQRADAVVTGVVETYVRERSSHDEVTDLLVPIYRRYLTKSDVEQLIRFYHTSVGRKLASVTPSISLASSRVGQQWAQSIAPDLEARLMKTLKQQGMVH